MKALFRLSVGYFQAPADSLQPRAEPALPMDLSRDDLEIHLSVCYPLADAATQVAANGAAQARTDLRGRVRKMSHSSGS